MSKPIALFDIDNTMYQGFSYFEFIKKQVDEKLVHRHTLDDALAAMQAYKNKQQDYETTVVQLLDIYAVSLKDVEYQAIYDSTFSFISSPINFLTTQHRHLSSCELRTILP